MSLNPCPEHSPLPCPVDPLESALLSAWSNSPDVMDEYRDEESEDASDSGQDR
ncbi:MULTISPECIES: hypothetical protein [Streptomyces]|uniref:hypothetical protein n=1 Tax=Streptomyces TaxID=1883 RepID=UPI00159F2779|nr:hypothetical protein [Streptomyces sp. EN23]WSV89248.1 hypothetical protein OG449_07740 [Streptomyces globisporus]